MRTIKDMQNGDTATVVRVHGTGAVRKRVLDMGLTKGAPIVLVKRAPLGDPIEIKVRNYSLSLRNKEAEIVEVE
ncbi:MAG: ferrous iron transport protein A [Candidatus Methanomethylophilaceae archaeon]|jgi:ferrous iron transport protein A